MKARQLFLLNIFLFIGLIYVPGPAFSQSQGLPGGPKNVILMIGDGMGYNCVIAADYYFGPSACNTFPVKMAVATFHIGFSYDPDKAWTDTSYVTTGHTESSAAATALSTGYKTALNMVGMSPSMDTLMNLTEFTKKIGKSAGVVTSVPFTHATPAGFTVHNSSRYDYPGIAYDMLLSSRCDVIMGCGNPEFDNNRLPLEKDWGYCGYVGDSSFWRALKYGSGKQTTFTVKGTKRTLQDVDFNGIPDPWTVITDMEDFTKLMSGDTPKRVLGCPEVHLTLQQARFSGENGPGDPLPYEVPLNSDLPSLAMMTVGSLNILDNNPEGFFLMVEGGAIDWANHENRKGRMLEEMDGFRDAIDSVIAYVEKYSSWDETLLIVTADHESGNLWGGLPFTPVGNNGIGEMPTLQYNSSDHTNALVPLFAIGNSAGELNRFADEQDPVRGKYIQNIEIPALIYSLWQENR